MWEILVLIISLAGLLILMAWLAPKPERKWTSKAFSPADISGLTVWVKAGTDGHLYDMLTEPPRRVADVDDSDSLILRGPEFILYDRDNPPQAERVIDYLRHMYNIDWGENDGNPD